MEYGYAFAIVHSSVILQFGLGLYPGWLLPSNLEHDISIELGFVKLTFHCSFLLFNQKF